MATARNGTENEKKVIWRARENSTPLITFISILFSRNFVGTHNSIRTPLPNRLSYGINCVRVAVPDWHLNGADEFKMYTCK